ncbi:MAG: adaptor protein MecA [Ruminococcus sp.]|nr:adaptor protein MecA [Ruminococcus sp.]
MLIEQLSDISVKFTLSQSELNEYNLDFNSISRYDANTRTMISHLILLAESQEGIDVHFGNSEVYVEAFSCSDGRYIVYISLIENPHRYLVERSNFFLCMSDNLNHLIRLSKQLVKFSLDDINSSTLYLQDDVFFLLIECTKKSFEKILYSVMEFCEYTTKRPNSDIIDEHWHCLAQPNALQRLSLLKP